jgi:hypothetical protein
MKLLSILCIAAGLVFVGCGEKADKPASSGNTTSSGNPLTAPVDYLDAAAKAKQSAVKTIDTTSLDKAIQMFNVDQGHNPKDLNELVEKKYIPQIPTPPFGTKLVYNADAGTVKVEKDQ